ncbi:hypothetical protein [Quadrisphaera sp. KR29]|uniref:hypothetical protein n=1 Tax=Quadrisphaera sp. KR29 TaxID=3461391 RepID=UPI0040441F38
MTSLLAFAALVAALVVVALVVLDVIEDGYGHRPPPPRSDWSDGHLPSHAYREG